MKGIQRIISVWVAVCLVLSMLPMQAFASETNPAIETNAPVINSVYVDKTQIVAGESVTVTMDVTDESDLDQVNVTFDTPNEGVTNMIQVSLSKGEDGLYRGTLVTDSSFSEGLYYAYYIVAQDVHGNREQISSDRSVCFELVGEYIETNAPVINSVSLNKTQVQTGESVTVTMDVTDESELAQVYVSFEMPFAGVVKRIDVPLIKGEDGLYMGTLTTDETYPCGTYYAYYIVAQDVHGNRNQINSDKSVCFEMISSGVETNSPVINSITLDKSEVVAGETVSITVDVADESELTDVYAYFDTPIAAGSSLEICVNLTLGEDGLYRGTLTTDESFANGNYYVSACIAKDVYGNYTQIQDKSACFELSGGYEDTTAPVITDIIIDKREVIAGETVIITVDIADESDLFDAYVYFNTPVAAGSSLEICVNLTLGEDSLYRGTLTTDESFANGNYYVSACIAKDVYGNYTHIQDKSACFELSGGHTEINAPVINSVTLDKSKVTAGETVAITVDVTDESELTDVYVYFNTPIAAGSSLEICVNLTLDEDGLYRGNLPTDKSFANGNYYVSACIAKDVYGNYTQIQDKSACFEFGVTKIETDAPVINRITLDKSQVVTGESVTVTMDITDESELDQLYVEFDTPHAGVVKRIHVDLTKDEDGLYSGTLTTDDTYPYGTYYAYYIVAQDVLGNRAQINSDTSVAFNVVCRPEEHIWEEGTVTKEPTEEDPGVCTYTCTVCGKTKMEEIPALGHNMVDDKGYAATCTEPGLTDGQHCTRCDAETVEQEVIPALGHNMVDDKGYAATCTEPGLTDGKHCSVCDKVIVAQEVIPAKHSWSDASCAATKTCVTCGTTEGTTIPHKFDQEKAEEKYLVSKATYTEPAVYYKSCICGEKGADTFTYGSPLAHDHELGADECVCGAIRVDENTFPDANFRGYILEQEYGKDSWLTKAELNNVTSMDVSNKDIQNLAGIGYFTAMTTLSCNSNQLTSLDISGCTALMTLQCSDNSRTIFVKSNQFDLNALAAEGFDISRASNWQGGVVRDNILTATSDRVTYCYDVGRATIKTFTLLLDGFCVHSWNPSTCVTPMICAFCGMENGAPMGSHSWLDATCTAPKTCNTCGATEGTALGHTKVFTSGKAPTCTESGYTDEEICSKCGEVFIPLEYLEALGHTEITVPGKSATCTETGLSDGKHCSVCGEILAEQEIVAALDHTEVIDKAVAATCTEPGLTDGKHCSVCNEVLVKQETVKELGHTEVIDKTVAATCIETGLTEGKHCDVCGTVTVAQEVITAGHSYVRNRCSICGEGDPEYACGENAFWHLDLETGILTIFGTGTMTDYTLNDIYVWYPYRTAIKQIVIEEGITDIANAAFNGCVNVTAVSIPDSVTQIDNSAFSLCSSLTSVTIPDSVTSIGAAFYGCSSLNSIIIPKSVTCIDVDVFRGCSQRMDVLYGGTENQWNDFGIVIWFPSIYNIHYDVTDPANHWYADSKEATCISEAYTCEICSCNYERNKQYIPGLLSHTEVIDTAVNPTCTDTGLTEGKHCAICGFVFVSQEVVDALGCSFTAYKSNADATCIADGTKTAFCDHGCGASDVIADEGSLNADAHNFGDWITEGNNSRRVCSLCGYTENKVTTEDGDVEIEIPDQPDVEVEVDPVEPSDENYVLVEEALNNESNAEQEILKAFDINLKNAYGVHVQPNGTVKVKLPLDWDKNGNYKVYRVNDDGSLTDMNAYRQGSHMVFETDHFSLYVIVEEAHSEEVHKHNYHAVVTAPDCTETGYTTYICHCGDTYKGDYVNAKGHNWNDANCTDPKTCNTCGETEGIALGHDWSEWDIVDATCTVDGSKTRSCNRSDCNETETDVIPATGEHVYDQKVADAKYLVSEATDTTLAVYRKSCKCGAAGEETFTAGEPVVPEFKDVPGNAYYHDPVMWAVEKKITNGVGDGTIFEPDSGCTRGQIATFLWRAAGCPAPQSNVMPFKDVPTDDYFSTAVIWAAENGITNGTGDGTTFEPHTTCTRGQIVTFLSRYLKGAPSSSENPFQDVPNGAYYTDAVLWAVEKGITNGVGDGTVFEPDSTCTRGMIVTFLYRALNQKA